MLRIFTAAMLAVLAMLWVATPFVVGTLIWLITSSLTWGIVAGFLSQIPFLWVFLAARQDKQDLDDYYQSL